MGSCEIFLVGMAGGPDEDLNTKQSTLRPRCSSGARAYVRISSSVWNFCVMKGLRVMVVWVRAEGLVSGVQV